MSVRRLLSFESRASFGGHYCHSHSEFLKNRFRIHQIHRNPALSALPNR